LVGLVWGYTTGGAHYSERHTSKKTATIRGCTSTLYINRTLNSDINLNINLNLNLNLNSNVN
jgi:hypothetical protein